MPVSFAGGNPDEENSIPQPAPESQADSTSKDSPLMDKINLFLIKFSRVPLKEKLFFVQHLSIMLKAGISLSAALRTLSEQTENKYFSMVLKDIGEKVEKGSSFADSLRPYERVFGELFASMIEAGEISGKLEDVLNELYIQLKKEHALLSKVKGALTYPAVIVVAMIGIGTFMMIAVVPRLTSMFDEMDAELPLPTQILIKVSDTMSENAVLTVGGMLAVVFLIHRILKTQKGKYIFQGIILKMPVISPIVRKINQARFARNISSLLKTDIMIIRSFQITANVLGNLHYREAINDMAQKIKKGGKIHETIRKYPHLFTPMVAQMVAIGEETGELDNILIELAEFYEGEVDNVMENLPAIIEPLLILVLGIGIGGVAIAVIMPMYSIGSAF